LRLSFVQIIEQASHYSSEKAVFYPWTDCTQQH
jgi:hypothetical protein